MAPSTLVSRDTQVELPVIIICTVVIIGVIFLAVGVWFLVRLVRNVRSRRRERSVINKGAPHPTDYSATLSKYQRSLEDGDLGIKSDPFNRPVRPRPPRQNNLTREEIIAHHTSTGTMPLPFAPFAAGTANAGTSSGIRNSNGLPPGSISHRSHFSISSSIITPPSVRHSRISSLTTSIRNSGLSLTNFAMGNRSRDPLPNGHNRMASSASSVLPSGSQLRKVRATFEPLLPDELVLTVGEKVTVVEIFDDGWCVVGRTNYQGEIEMGALPIWCFEKPVKGWKDERMMRSSSLGITVVLDEDGANRDTVISWSNF